MPRRQDIVNASRTWIGTPFRHQASLRGAGCDCLGLVRGVYRDLYGVEPEAVPAYPQDWAEGGRSEDLAVGLARHLAKISIAAARTGDVLLFRLCHARPAKHAAIQTGLDKMIHSWERGAVLEQHLSAPWRRRIAFAFSFPGLTD